MTDVFISYKREEKAAASQIAAALEGYGYTVWWDADILPGEEYRKRTLSILRECKAAIVAWSPLSAASSWVQDEAELALKRGVLVPVLIQPIDTFPLGFGQLHAHTLVGWDGSPSHPLFKPVIAAIAKLAGEPEAQRAQPNPDPRKTAAEADVAFWRGIHDSKNRADFEAYLVRYPDGVFADLARQRVMVLGSPAPATTHQSAAMPLPKMLSDPALGPSFGLGEVLFLLVVAIVAPILLWPLVNAGLGAPAAVYNDDYADLFNIHSAINFYWGVPVLVALAWLNERAEAWLRLHQPSWGVAALRWMIGAALVLTFMIRIGHVEDGGSLAHFALWSICVWVASLFARRLAPRLAAVFKND